MKKSFEQSREGMERAPAGRDESQAGEAIKVYGRSFSDPATQLYWKGERMFCRVTGRSAFLLRALWQEGVLEQFSQEGFLSPVELLPGPDEHECSFLLANAGRIGFWYEWSPAMWKAAALHMIEFLLALENIALTLRNFQPWDLLFQMGQPKCIHPGAIFWFEQKAFTATMETIARYLIYPLLLSTTSQSRLASVLLRDTIHGIPSAEFSWVQEFSDATQADLERLPPREFLLKLKHRVEGLEIRYPNALWQEYENLDMPLAPRQCWSQKRMSVHRILSELHPASVLDCGCNTGWYSTLAAANGAEVIAADTDHASLDLLFTRIRLQKIKVLPLAMDINDPSPPYGPENAWFPPAVNRLQCDLLLVLALSHHLIFSEVKLGLEQLVDAISPLAKKWLLIEFIPFEGANIPYSPGDHPGSERWYRQDSFIQAFMRKFSKVTILPSSPGKRKLLFFEK
jgi:SAM-dependent methyltransferase